MDKSNTKRAYGKAAEYIYSVFSTFLICMMIIFIAFSFFFRLVQVTGDSMNPTLETGDRLIISNVSYTPDYGDIIAVNKNGIENSSMIKRVIALPGDSVSIDFDTHLITVNGKVLFEDYEITEPISERYDFKGPVTVPENSVFVLGDNRNNSIDSRTESIGFITFDEISGKALTRLFPVGRFNIY
ncbi:MAG: signal peptidase I [Ruminococcaceae bacterium]|nr:signal peptidase I [Oscillospiraceae bacterium]